MCSWTSSDNYSRMALYTCVLIVRVLAFALADLVSINQALITPIQFAECSNEMRLDQTAKPKMTLSLA